MTRRTPLWRRDYHFPATKDAYRCNESAFSLFSFSFARYTQILLLAAIFRRSERLRRRRPRPPRRRLGGQRECVIFRIDEAPPTRPRFLYNLDLFFFSDTPQVINNFRPPLPLGNRVLRECGSFWGSAPARKIRRDERDRKRQKTGWFFIFSAFFWESSIP